MPDLPKDVQEAIKNGDTVLQLTGENDEQYFFKKPKPVDMNRFLATSQKGKVAAAVKNLIYDLAIHPSPSDLKSEFRDKPGRMVALNNALQTEVGLNEDYAVKKL
ncbi:MAG: hypothetical protein MI862_26690 [Desulfobacterales bacterium]|nr:hypothetical protein [Desulfobacterales bacterium]